MIRSICAFVFVCLCGLFCAIAGGAEWGTAGTGLVSLVTIMGAILAAVAVHPSVKL